MTLTKQLEEKEAELTKLQKECEEAEKKAKEVDELATRLVESERLRRESEDRARRAGDAVRKAKETAVTEKEEAVKAALKDAATKTEAEKAEAIEVALKAEAEKKKPKPEPEPHGGKKPPAKPAYLKAQLVPILGALAFMAIVLAIWWFGFHEKGTESAKPSSPTLSEQVKAAKAELATAEKEKAEKEELANLKAKLSEAKGEPVESQPVTEQPPVGPTAPAGQSAPSEPALSAPVPQDSASAASEATTPGQPSGEQAFDVPTSATASIESQALTEAGRAEGGSSVYLPNSDIAFRAGPAATSYEDGEADKKHYAGVLALENARIQWAKETRAMELELKAKLDARRRPGRMDTGKAPAPTANP